MNRLPFILECVKNAKPYEIIINYNDNQSLKDFEDTMWEMGYVFKKDKDKVNAVMDLPDVRVEIHYRPTVGAMVNIIPK